jgi:topoisomerase-4 subunit A
MKDLKELMRKQYIEYASYVVLQRAVPEAIDGLKPVQRRILHVLKLIHDGKMHKVANVVGQTMAFHPHGDAAISEALTNMAMKGFLMDMQGNFGNLFTGDPAAASRYIETRLSQMALDTMFNSDLTKMLPSYDGRNEEPVSLPAKIPLVLLQGVNGIAVGMSTNILPHNFVELIEAEIAILEGLPYSVLPDFPTGGIMDASEYSAGRGKVKLRAKLDITDPKTIVIREICHGTTTESLIRSIDEAAKRGKIKIDAINDYTSDKVEIEISLPRGHYAQDVVDALYAFTECEVSLSSQVLVIKDDKPWETDVDALLHYHVEKLQGYIKMELEIERDNLLQKIYDKTLEQIFIENRLYKKIENVNTYEKVHSTIEESLKPFHEQLQRIPSQEDRERLLSIQIRRISQYDMNKNRDDILALEKKLQEVLKDLKQVKKVTIRYLKDLLKKYGADFGRRTQIQQIEEIDRKAVATKNVKVVYDSQKGYIGLKVTGDYTIECTNYDKILVIYDNGVYFVSNIEDKKYIHHTGAKVVYVGVADKKTVFNIVYRDQKSRLCYAKRFVVSKFILDKEYRYFDEGVELQYFTTAAEIILDLRFVPKPKQKLSRGEFTFKDVLVKGVTAKGIRLSSRPVKTVGLKKGEEDAPQLDLFVR